jgi:fluoride exporter
MRPTPFQLRRLAAIYLGGAIGAVARVGLAEGAPHGVGSWPWATFVVGATLALGYIFVRLGIGLERRPETVG